MEMKKRKYKHTWTGIKPYIKIPYIKDEKGNNVRITEAESKRVQADENKITKNYHTVVCLTIIS